MLQPKITSIETLPSYKLKLGFETGEVKCFDVLPYISGDWFELLRDPKYFNTVRLLPNGVGIEWSDGQDIAPHELYELSVPV